MDHSCSLSSKDGSVAQTALSHSIFSVIISPIFMIDKKGR